MSVFFVFPVFVFAQTESQHISTFHSDYGQKLIQEGNPQEAADQFIQALFFAPSNKVAKENLLLFAQNESFESKSVKMQIFRFTELADYITFLKDRLQKLEKANTTNIQFLLEETKTADPRLAEVKAIRSQIEEQKLPLIRPPEDIQGEYSDRWTKLVKINKYFLSIKESLLEQFSVTLSAYERLNALKTQIAKSATEEQRHQLTDQYENELTAVKRVLVQRERTLKEQESQMRLLQKNLATVRSDFEYLQSKMDGTNQRMTDLTKKLADMSMQVYEKEALLADKSNANGKLEADIHDAQQRWELVQKIIHEKDEQIKNLEDRTAGGIMSADGSDVSGNAKMDSLYEKLSTLQKKMEEVEKSNQETTSSLRKEFALLQVQYAQLDQASQEKDLLIDHLKNDVTVRNRKLANIAGFFNAYDQDIAQLNGILEIYRGKLSVTHAVLTDKDKKLQTLEKEVAELKQRFDHLQQTKINEAPNFPMGMLGETEVLQRTKTNLGRLQNHFFDLKDTVKTNK